MSECRICGREPVDGRYCRYHRVAFDNLREKYAVWKEAAGVSWDDYLERLRQNPETGRWVLELIEDLMTEDDPSVTA